MQLAYINLLRSVAVIVVVFFHIYALFWQKGIYGLADDCNPWYIMIRCGFITVAIPLYFCLAGYCFAWSFKQGHYQGINEVIKKKAKRLLLPFFVFSAVMIVISDGTISIGHVLRGNLAHLWFLPSLFWCFVFGYILLRYTEAHPLVCIPFWLLTSLFPMTDIVVPRIFGLQGTYDYLCWFVLGLLLNTYNPRLSAWFRWCPRLYLMMVVWPVMLTISPIEYGDTQSLLMLLATAAMITAVCLINKSGIYLTRWGGGNWKV